MKEREKRNKAIEEKKQELETNCGAAYKDYQNCLRVRPLLAAVLTTLVDRSKSRPRTDGHPGHRRPTRTARHRTTRRASRRMGRNQGRDGGRPETMRRSVRVGGRLVSPALCLRHCAVARRLTTNEVHCCNIVQRSSSGAHRPWLAISLLDIGSRTFTALFPRDPASPRPLTRLSLQFDLLHLAMPGRAVRSPRFLFADSRRQSTLVRHARLSGLLCIERTTRKSRQKHDLTSM